MAQDLSQPLLARMSRATPQKRREKRSIASQLRFAVSQAAAGAGLAVTPYATELRSLPAAQVASEIAGDRLILRLLRDGATVGICALDPVLVAGLLDVRTKGEIGAVLSEKREFTLTDSLLVAPFVRGLVAQIAGFEGDNALSSAALGLTVGGACPAGQAVALALGEGQLHHMDISVSLPLAGCEGQIAIAFKDVHRETRVDDGARQGQWRAALAQNVMSSAAHLQVILTRLRLPLSTVQGLAAGDVLPLVGVRTTGIRVETPDGTLVVQARLGQSGGLRAVRVEAPVAVQMQDLARIPLTPDARAQMVEVPAMS